MRTINLEFLRHGPPNNQLLSPLTRYLVLCGNRPAVTVEVPFEHSEFMMKLKFLRYEEGRTGNVSHIREMQIEDTAKILARMLGNIPGLISELGDSTDDDCDLTHFRLILSANELALLPFELANVPAGAPGAGQPLGLQTDRPLCLTREIRRVKEETFDWPKEPKILFAFASPGGIAPVPYEAHTLALRQIIEPWMYYYEEDDKDNKEMFCKVAQHLRILPNASVETIAQACASGEYTYIHILAHGIQFEKGEDLRYGLALHDSRQPNMKDTVSGDRLATAIRSRINKGLKTLVRPAVVTIASCDGGNVGTVYGAGASIAHALHQAGIPLVVASQFPLSFAGSIYMVKILYDGLLKGDDPRLSLDLLRRELKRQLPKTHDWASIVAYASLPENIEEQLSSIRIDRADRKIRAAHDQADRPIEAMSIRLMSKSKQTQWDKTRPWMENQEKIDRALRRLHEAMEELERFLDGSKNNTIKIYGFLASAEKRAAEIRSRAIVHIAGLPQSFRDKYKDGIRPNLERSLYHYSRLFELDRTSSWALVQQLWLKYLLGEDSSMTTTEWQMARMLSLNDIEISDQLEIERVAWARSNMIELYVIALLYPNPEILLGVPANRAVKEARKQAEKEAEALIDLHKRHQVDLSSSIRQLFRYFEVFEETRPIPSPARDLAITIFEKLIG